LSAEFCGFLPNNNLNLSCPFAREQGLEGCVDEPTVVRCITERLKFWPARLTSLA